MRNGKLRGLLITLMLLVFLAGLASILYPYIWGAAVDSSIASTAIDFLDREEPELPATTVIIDSVEPEKVKPYPEPWEDMVRYNQSIAAQGQSGCKCRNCGRTVEIPSYWLRHSNPNGHCKCTRFKG